MRFPLSSAAYALAMIVPASVSAAGQETVTVRIDIADIDLSSGAGRDAAEARLDDILRTACTIESNSRYAYSRDVVDQKCVADARAAALAQVERIAAKAGRSGGAVAAN